MSPCRPPPCLPLSVSLPLRVSPSPCLSLSVSPPLRVSPSPCLPLSVSPPLRVSPSPCLPLSVSPPLRVSPSPCLSLSVSPPLRVSPSPCLPLSVSPPLRVSPSPRLPYWLLPSGGRAFMMPYGVRSAPGSANVLRCISCTLRMERHGHDRTARRHSYRREGKRGTPRSATAAECGSGAGRAGKRSSEPHLAGRRGADCPARRLLRRRPPASLLPPLGDAGWGRANRSDPPGRATQAGRRPGGGGRHALPGRSRRIGRRPGARRILRPHRPRQVHAAGVDQRQHGDPPRRLRPHAGIPRNAGPGGGEDLRRPRPAESPTK